MVPETLNFIYPNEKPLDHRGRSSDPVEMAYIFVFCRLNYHYIEDSTLL